MDITAIAITAIVFGCGTGVITKMLDTFGGRKKETLSLEAKAAQERARTLELQLVETNRQNETLQKQLEWHTKMLDTQDKLMKQITDGNRERASA